MKSSAWLSTLSRHTCQAGRAGEVFRPLNFVNMLLDFSPQLDIQDDPMKQVE